MANSSSFKTHEEYLDWFRAYRKKNRIKLRKYNREYNKRWRDKYGYERDKVRFKVYWAIKRGQLKREPCVKCGKLEVQAHHTDYSKPLKVIWLCIPHHKEADRKLKKVAPK